MLGSSKAFVIALALTAVWLVTGPMYGFSDAWQLVLNTVMSILTLLMVLLLENTQNRDTAALHLKLNELLRIDKEARQHLLGAEDFSDRELGHHRSEFREFARKVMKQEQAEGGE